MKVLETKRMILRPFEIKDLDDFYEYAKMGSKRWTVLDLLP